MKRMSDFPHLCIKQVTLQVLFSVPFNSQFWAHSLISRTLKFFCKTVQTLFGPCTQEVKFVFLNMGSRLKTVNSQKSQPSFYQGRWALSMRGIGHMASLPIIWHRKDSSTHVLVSVAGRVFGLPRDDN